MSIARRLLAAASWLYGAQIVSVVAQFGYAALTSRVVSAQDFGIYSIGLTVTALSTLLAAGGLGQTVARMEALEPLRVRGLLGVAVILGGVGGGVLFLTADFWAWLWGSPASALVVRVLSFGTAIAPALGLAAGLMRRVGRFRSLAVLTLGSNLVGMVVGALVVVVWANSVALAISALVAQSLTLAGCIVLSQGLLTRIGRPSSALGELGFSGRVTANTLVNYFNGNIGRWSVSVTGGQAVLGQWNRADVLTQVPFQQVQTAMVQALYPEFRHHRDGGTRAERVWTDLLSLAAWFAIPIGAALAVGGHLVAPFIFGPGWELAAALVVPLAILASIQVLTSILANAVEAIARFRWLWLSQAGGIIVFGGGAVVTLATGFWWAVIASLLLGVCVQHGLLVAVASRRGFLRGGYVVASYAGAALASSMFCGGLYVLLTSLSDPALVAMGAGAAGGTIAVLLVIGRRLTPIRAAKRLGLIR